MMKKPVLVVMAAGMGSRYGGLKQIDPIDKEGHIIMDFSIYDAVRAGFEKVVFIIKRENEEALQRYPDAGFQPAGRVWHWLHGPGCQRFCGFSGAGRTERVADPARWPDFVWRQPVPELLGFCGQPVFY